MLSFDNRAIFGIHDQLAAITRSLASAMLPGRISSTWTQEAGVPSGCFGGRLRIPSQALEMGAVIMEGMRMWQTIRTSVLGRHAHEEAYAALVLSGGYEEAGDNGRFHVKAGDVVFHGLFEAHLDRFSETGAVVLNLPLPLGCSFRPGIARVADPDSVARMAERSRRVALDLLSSIATSETPHAADWPDELAAAMIQNPSLKLSYWGESNGIPPWTVSRGFTSVFGVSPEAFRARARARRALRFIHDTSVSLADIAAEIGFADQSHMTRSIRQLTGIAPQVWRSSANGFKTSRKVSA
jgi:AraC-like DNA-binding protein